MACCGITPKFCCKAANRRLSLPKHGRPLWQQQRVLARQPIGRDGRELSHGASHAARQPRRIPTGAGSWRATQRLARDRCAHLAPAVTVQARGAISNDCVERVVPSTRGGR